MDSERVVCKTYVLINSNLKKLLGQLTNCFYFSQTLVNFCKKEKKGNISKTKKALLLEVYFLKLLICIYLRTKFEVSGIILTSFRQG